MITGDRIRQARERAGWTQAELAKRVGVSPRTVGNWERGETDPLSASARLEAILRDYLHDVGEPPLRSVSDAELLAEIARRFARGAQQAKFSAVEAFLQQRVADFVATAPNGETVLIGEAKALPESVRRDLRHAVAEAHLEWVDVDVADPAAGSGTFLQAASRGVRAGAGVQVAPGEREAPPETGTGDGVDEPDDLAARRRALKAEQIAADQVPSAARDDEQGDSL